MSDPAQQEAPPTRSLVRKLAEVMALVGNVEKKGHNREQNYDYARESDLVEKVRPELAERHVILTLTTVSHERVVVYKTASGKDMTNTILTVEGTWHDGDSGESLSAGQWIGYGADISDKGVYKAMTGAEKYLLMKSFLVSTGDDPEGDEKVDKAEAAAAAAATGRSGRGRVSRPAAQTAGVQRGGQSGVATRPQLEAIKEGARALGFKAADIAALARMVLMTEDVPDDAEGLGARLARMTGEEAGKIIGTMNDLRDAKTPDGEPQGEAAQAAVDAATNEPTPLFPAGAPAEDDFSIS